MADDEDSSRFGKVAANALPFSEPSWVHSPNSPFHRESHHKLRLWLRNYLETDVFPYAQGWEVEGVVPYEAVRGMARKGLILPSIPRKYRNERNLPADIPDEEWDLFHTLLVNEELSRSPANGPIWAMSSGSSIGCPPILNFGTEEQRMEYLPRVHRGELRFCLAVTEPGAGSDVSAIFTTAILDQKDQNYFIVNGRKKWITNGMFADFATTLVRTSTSPSSSSRLSLLIIPLRSLGGELIPGITARKIHTSGLNASGTAFINFKDVRVPRRNLIGREGNGFQMIMANFNPERLILAGSALVLSRTCLNEAMAQSLRRKTFGKALIENQVMRSKFASMIRSIESTRAWFESTVWEVEQAARHAARESGSGGRDYAKAFTSPTLAARVALVKVQAGKTLELAAREAQQVFGAAGTTRDGLGAIVEQISRDLRVWVVGGGSEEILDDMGIRLSMVHLNLRVSR